MPQHWCQQCESICPLLGHWCGGVTTSRCWHQDCSVARGSTAFACFSSTVYPFHSFQFLSGLSLLCPARDIPPVGRQKAFCSLSNMVSERVLAGNRAHTIFAVRALGHDWVHYITSNSGHPTRRSCSNLGSCVVQKQFGPSPKGVGIMLVMLRAY